MTTLPFRSNLSICRLLQDCFPRYRKRDVWIKTAECVEPFGYWHDGGSISDYHTLDTSTGKLARMAVPNGPPPFCKIAEPVTLRPGLAIVTSGKFRGKTATLSVTLHPSDALVPVLTDDAKVGAACGTR